MDIDKPSVKVLKEAIELQLKKSNDYQNPNSRVKQSDYYEHGIDTLLDTVKAKYLRIISISEALKAGQNVNYEGIKDSCIDSINYLSFICAYMDGDIQGQSSNKDIFNRDIISSTPTAIIPSKFLVQGDNNG